MPGVVSAGAQAALRCGMRATPLLFVLAAACGGAKKAPAPAPAPPVAKQPEVVAPEPAAPPEPPPPPVIEWGDPVAKSAVPKIYRTVHAKADNRATCPLLVLTDLGDGDGAKPRKANFAGGWAVAYDKPGLPGTAASGESCADCGRSAFGIAGAGVSARDGGGPEWPNHARWDDGSTAGYGPEGGDGPSILAYVTVKDADCLYNVWSALGTQHLEVLLTGLRRVAP